MALADTPTVAAANPALRARSPAETLSTKLFYGFGSVAFGVKDNGFSVLLLLYYNQVLGLPAQMASLAVMLALIIDAFLDPVVGYASDHLRSRWGRRHPFMYAAAVPAALSYLLLWNPPDLSHWGLFAYLVVVAVIVRSFITCYEIPSASLVSELTDNYDQRTSFLSFRYFFGWMGGLTMYVLAFSVFLTPTPEHPVGQLNPDGYHTYGLAAAALMFTAIMVSALGTHRMIPYLRKPPEAAQKRTVMDSLREIFQTLGHKSALALFSAGIFSSMATGLGFALNVYFTTYFWRLSAAQMSVLSIGSWAAAFGALFLAPKVSAWLGKKPGAMAASVCSVVLAPVPFILHFMGLFPPLGSSALIPMLIVFGALTTGLGIISAILVSSMIADVVEDSELRTGRRSEGVFFAANAFIQKCVSGIGIFVSGMILALVSFPVGATPADVGGAVLRDLVVTSSLAVAVLNLTAVGFLAIYSISREKHAENLAKLAERA